MNPYRFALASFCVLPTALPVSAQQEAATGAFTLDPIYLDVQFRQETEQEVPISVTSVQSDELKARGADRLDKVLPLVPNANFATVRGGIEASSVALRGISTTAYGADPSVAFYMDGVYVGADSAFDGEMPDLTAVNVMQGPQGTLSGHNAIGGAVQMRTADPEFGVNSTKLTFGVAEHGERSGEIVGNAALGERAALRYVLKRTYSDGWLVNEAGGDNLDSKDTLTGRIKLKAQVTDTWTSLLSYDHSKDKGRRYGFGPLDEVADTRRADSDQPLDETVENEGLSWTNTWDLEAGRLESITAWRHSDSEMHPGAHSTVSPILRYSSRDYEQLSQELRLTGQTDRLDWTVGLFAMKSSDKRGEGIALRDDYDYDYGGTTYTIPAGYGERSRAKIESETLAAYFDGAWALTDRIGILGGLRVSHDKKSIDYNHADTAGNGYSLLALTQDLDLSTSGTFVSPRIGMTWDVTPEMTAYGMITAGYKPAGFVSSFAETSDLEYDRETAINYELGLKGTLGGDMWRYALSAFYMDIKDQQVYSMKGSSTVFSIANAPKSRSKGLELSFDGQATRNLRLGAAFGYADATFVDYPGSKIGDASGNRQPLSSKYTAALTAEYRLPLAGDSDLVVNADYTWRSKFYFDAENTLPQSAYGLANASVAIETGTWDLQLYCDNLFDKHYLRSAANLTEGDFGYAGAERTFGIRFTRTF